MEPYELSTPDRDDINELLEELGTHLEEMGDICERLSDSIEEYLDDTDSIITQAGMYLDGASRDSRINQMLRSELDALRKDLLLLLQLAQENGTELPEGSFLVDHSRLDPDLNWQDPELPFYDNDPDEYYFSLLNDQITSLVIFEENTPMTTSERKALREHVIPKMRFDPDPEQEWQLFLDGMRRNR